MDILMNKENDFQDSYKWIKINLDIVGAWPNKNLSVIKKCQVLANVILITTCIYIPRFVALYYLKNSLDGAVFSATTNLLYLVAVFKLLAIYYHRKVLRSMFDEISNDWNKLVTTGYEFVLKKYANISRDISSFSFWTLWTAVILNIFTQKYSNIEIDKKNAPDPRLTIDLIWVSYIPYDVHKTKTIFITHWIVQFYATLIADLIYDGFDGFCIFCILHVTGQLKILQIKLQNINTDKIDNENSNNLLPVLIHIVKRHQELIRFTETLENCFNKVLLSQLMGSCFIVSVQGYLLLGNFMKGELSLFQATFTISFIIYTLTHLFFSCYAGELLVQTSENIGIAAYKTPWYNLRNKEKYLIMFIIQNSMKPLKITTFKFSNLSYQLFFKVLKTSLSYLSVLLAAKDKLK